VWRKLGRLLELCWNRKSKEGLLKAMNFFENEGIPYQIRPLSEAIASCALERRDIGGALRDRLPICR